MSCIGEPTLDSHFKELHTYIKQNFPSIKISLNTNGSLFYDNNIRKEFILCDKVLISFNTISQAEFEKICKPHEDLTLEKIMDGISLFADEFSGELGFISFIVKDINDDINTANALKGFLIELNPHYLFLIIIVVKDSNP